MKKTKKILIFLSMVTLFFALFSFNSSAAIKSGQNGPTAYWKYDTDTCVLTISGTGYFGKGNINLSDGYNTYYKSIKTVVIEEGITEINANAFSDCTNLSSVSLPSTLKKIGESAFYNTGLSSITIPEGVVEISKGAFSYSSNLTEISLPNSLRYIGSDAFISSDYWNNESNWVNGVLYIDNHLIAMKGNYSEETFVIKEGTISIATGACCKYDDPDFKKVVFPSSLVSINADAFINATKLTEIVLPEGLEIIGDSAFFGCTKLATIKLPTTLTEIGTDAFANTSFYYNTDNWDGNSLYINNYLIKVNNFEDEEALYKIKDGTVLIAASALSKNHYEYITIPETVKYIGGMAFSSSKIKRLEIPDSVVKISGYGLLGSCKSLEYVKFSDKLSDIGGSVCMDCTNLKTVILPKNLKIIQKYAFSSCELLDNVIIPEGVTLIEQNAFRGTMLSKFSIPSTIEYVYNYSFYQINSVKNVYFTNSAFEFNLGFSGKNYHPHVNCEYIEEKAPTCSKPGNTRGVYCPDCDAYVLGYSEIPATGIHSYTSSVKSATCNEGGFTTYSCRNCTYSYTDNFTTATGHSYGSNGVCADCSEYNDAYNTEKEPEPTPENKPCSCNCHKTGFMGFIWKILRVFYKLFKTNAVCACGVAHY